MTDYLAEVDEALKGKEVHLTDLNGRDLDFRRSDRSWMVPTGCPTSWGFPEAKNGTDDHQEAIHDDMKYHLRGGYAAAAGK